MKYWTYLSYVIRHKWYVFIECCKLGVPFRGITHDLSKLLPSEFFPYMNYFYGGIERNCEETGYYKPTDTGDEKFDFAWLLHQKRNKHHWQWWILPKDDGGEKIMEMPLKYRKEMLADWRGAGRALHKPDTKAWYEENRTKIRLGQETREWIEDQFWKESV